MQSRTRLPAGVVGFGIVTARDAVWIWGPRDILQVNARTGAKGRRIVVDDEHGELTGVTAWRRWLVAATADGHLLRFDARTGARAGMARVGLRPPAVRGIARGRVLLSSAGVLAAADPSRAGSHGGGGSATGQARSRATPACSGSTARRRTIPATASPRSSRATGAS